jgi:hypothetical protein
VPPFLRRQVRGYVSRRSWFSDEDADALSMQLGRISKFQSVRSEDALTWSWFEPLWSADDDTRHAAVQWLYDRLGLGVRATRNITIDQWRRIRHPNAPSANGPEIDAVIDDPGGALIYVEAKWHASLGTGKGAVSGAVDDQIVLRRAAMRADEEFDRDGRPRVVLGVSRWAGDVTAYAESGDSGRPVAIRWLTWQDLAACPNHPRADEFARYVAWKQEIGG